jgi:hypothetical protein
MIRLRVLLEWDARSGRMPTRSVCRGVEPGAVCHPLLRDLEITANACALGFAGIVTLNSIFAMLESAAVLHANGLVGWERLYFTYTDDGIPRGIFGPLIQAMILLFR